MSNSITANKNLVVQTYNTADGTLPTSAVLTSGLTSGTAYTTWDVPENYNAAALDVVLGGTATVSVTGSSGTVALTADKYQPMVLLFTGTLTASVTYTIPSGVGGTWVVRNSTTGSYTITLSSLTAGASAIFAVPQDGLPYTVSLIAVSGGGFYIGTITDSSITTAKIADSAVTTAKIADSAITTAKINSYSITNTKLLPSVINDLTAKTTLASADEFSIYDSAAVVTISSITLSGAGPTYTATASTATAHGLSNGNSLTISGATGNTSVNGVFSITVTSTTQFTYTVTSGAAVTGSPIYVLNPGLKKITYANVTSAMATSLVNTFAPTPGYLFGLVLSNNSTDATNDIDVSVGVSVDNTTMANISVSAITKRLDANWAPGNNNGGRYSGAAITNTTYHAWAVAQTDGSGGDIYFDPSAVRSTVLSHIQAEAGGSLYTNARRIGSIVRASGAIRAFIQYGDNFLWSVPADDFNGTPSTSATTLALTVPVGVVVTAQLSLQLGTTVSNIDTKVLVTALTQADTDPASIYQVAVRTAGDNRGYGSAATVLVPTDTSAQIRYRRAGSSATLSLQTFGWFDTRGQTQ